MAKAGKIGQNIKTTIHAIAFDRVDSGETHNTLCRVLFICLLQFNFMVLSEDRGKIRIED